MHMHSVLFLATSIGGYLKMAAAAVYIYIAYNLA